MKSLSYKLKVKNLEIKGMYMLCLHNCQVAYCLCAIWLLNYLCPFVLYGHVSVIALI